MTKILIVLAVGVLMASCSFTAKPKSTESTMAQNIESVAPVKFKELVSAGEHTVIDIRTPEELLPANGGKLLESAINIDFYAPDFLENLKALDREAQYLIYCRSGSRTGQTLAIMEQLGFANVADLYGGKVAWDRAGLSCDGMTC